MKDCSPGGIYGSGASRLFAERAALRKGCQRNEGSEW